MSIVRPTILIGLALCVSACANIARPTVPGAIVASAPSPAPVPGYDWFYDDGPDEVRLAYGVEASDDARLALACSPGNPMVTLTADGLSGTRDIHLESGGDTEHFAAQAEPSPLSDGHFLTAQGSAHAPVFMRFRTLGWLALWDGKTRTLMVPQPQSAARIERFFARCG